MYFNILYCTVLYYNVLYCTILHYTALYCTVLYYTALYCTVLYCTAMYSTLLYSTVTLFYWIVLHCTVLTLLSLFRLLSLFYPIQKLCNICYGVFISENINLKIFMHIVIPLYTLCTFSIFFSFTHAVFPILSEPDTLKFNYPNFITRCAYTIKHLITYCSLFYHTVFLSHYIHPRIHLMIGN
jgi:hypothetical protein